MNAKVTLYSEKELIEKMKEYAKAHNTSLSQIVNQFFKTTLAKTEHGAQSAPKTKKLYGILKNSKIDEEDYKKYLEDKYL